MAGWDGDALAGQMEEAMERQQEAAEARLRKTVSREDLSSAAERESLRLSKARIKINSNARPTLRIARCWSGRLPP
jgi:hypothetical protein